MEHLTKKFDQIFIDQVSLNSKLANRVRDIFPKNKIQIVEGQPISRIRGTLSPEEFDFSKRNLFVTEFKGHFFKRCPGNGEGLACCNYFVLNLGIQCDMNCSYCYLQSFVNTPLMTMYSNIDRAIGELAEMSDRLRDKPLRVGTGETIDSLSLDELTLYSCELIDFFKQVPKWRLEFKTKSAQVDQFLDMPHAGNVIVSWSINPQEVIASEEHGTASLDERLQAAQKCLQRGFLVAFHIDPMIWHPEWKANYLSLVERIDREFSPDQIPYLSLGALRFQPEQKMMMRERFGFNSMVSTAEVFSGRDGKLRYDEHLRFEMFNTVIKAFKQRNSRWNVFLCMENHESWLQTFSESPRKVPGLDELFQPIRL